MVSAIAHVDSLRVLKIRRGGIFCVILDPAIDGVLIGDRYVKMPVLSGHFQAVDGRRGRWLPLRVDVALHRQIILPSEHVRKKAMQARPKVRSALKFEILQPGDVTNLRGLLTNNEPLTGIRVAGRRATTTLES